MSTIAREFSEHAQPRGTAHERRVLAASVVASVAVHAALIVAGPWRAPPEGSLDALPVIVATLRLPEEVPPAAAPAPPVTAPATPRPQAEHASAPTPAQDPVRPLQRAAPRPLPAETSDHPAVPPGVAAEDAAPADGAVRPAPSEDGAPSEPAAITRIATPPAEARRPADSAARYLSAPPPRYPLSARRDGIEGTVTIKVLVSAQGFPTRVEIAQSSGSNALDRAAVEAVRGWRFAPARRGAEAIDAWVLVPVEFHLRNG